VAKVASVREARNPEEDKPRELTPKEQEQMAFKYGNRKTRRKIAKRNKLFRDKSGMAWRESNRMIREERTDVAL